jgi:hypothetical protein
MYFVIGGVQQQAGFSMPGKPVVYLERICIGNLKRKVTVLLCASTVFH